MRRVRNTVPLPPVQLPFLVPAVWPGALAGSALLVALAGTVGPIGLLTGLGCLVAINALLGAALRRAGRRTLTPADLITLLRATLVAGVAALVADSFGRPVELPALVGLATVALLLDAVDGWVARRTGTSELGARFDLETDALLIGVLSCYVATLVGPWVLAIGLARYAYLAAERVLPWLREPVPPRYWNKVVAAIQGITLSTVVAGVLPHALAVGTLLIALTLLAESFGRQAGWLARQHRSTWHPDPRELVGAVHG
jgi:phosphatidylglycerophosphate synthase